MKIRQTPKVFQTTNNLGYHNLVVGGCSFTYNISDHHSSSWPYYVRDKCGFKEVYDCSVQAAGNYQIMTSIIYALESTLLDPCNTLVIIMWSGYSRDSMIIGKNVTDNPDYVYHYTERVKCVVSNPENKTRYSRSLENYIYIVALWEYLKSKGYETVFLDFVDPKLPVRDTTFDITEFLSLDLSKRFKSMFSPIENFYQYCVKHNLLQDDDFHPTTQGHLSWTNDVLAPSLTKNPNIV